MIDRAAFNQAVNAQYEPYISESETNPLLIRKGPNAIAYKVWPAGVSQTLDCSFGTKQGLDDQHINGGASLFVASPHHAIRRLTPLECERLQGFPDNWTNVPGMSNTTRYQCCGNSMTVNVMNWIGKRIDATDKILQMLNVMQ